MRVRLCISAHVRGCGCVDIDTEWISYDWNVNGDWSNRKNTNDRNTEAINSKNPLNNTILNLLDKAIIIIIIIIIH